MKLTIGEAQRIEFLSKATRRALNHKGMTAQTLTVAVIGVDQKRTDNLHAAVCKWLDPSTCDVLLTHTIPVEGHNSLWSTLRGSTRLMAVVEPEARELLGEEGFRALYNSLNSVAWALSLDTLDTLIVTKENFNV